MNTSAFSLTLQPVQGLQLRRVAPEDPRHRCTQPESALTAAIGPAWNRRTWWIESNAADLR